jgi:tetratricopeptide (TPR) repeat protein
MLGAKAYEKGKYGHAYAFFTRAGELTPRPALLFSRAQALRKLGGRREEAITLYEAYLATDNPTRKGDAESAIAELFMTPSGDSDADAATAREHFSKGAAQYEAGQYGHAYDQFTMAGELTDRPAQLFSRAQTLRKLGGREAEAMALYEQYIEAAGEGGSRVEDATLMLELLPRTGRRRSRRPPAAGPETTPAGGVAFVSA